ncbi:two-partner secretion domain-containing protein [Limnoraphis robusta]|uniref:two-partner secretion domain-containing protein n=1 Tax=Limnoraphis robusta TaxID=1118279 RepID=UPI002B200163|nr:filamentous hemagglutinin N-terminal domain-containing protein [Limnoraphis robusta]MEA5500489.1 filamentous hemagglutinin N-terminal domain-containing protein [Limnoraphis robusta BA-68 BA1]
MSPRLLTFPALATLTTLFSATPLTALAQIVPDNTLGSENSVVTPNINIRGINSDRIDGGAVRGGNLFHSFQEFNIREGRGAYFSNPDNIINILTRVTGGNISEILGTLGVLGNANLFLINPAGIVFGPNARLDVGGSFFATTADGVLFENGFEFAASNPEAPPLLTINMPLGLNIRENPGAIVNQTLPQLVRLDESPLRNDAGFLIPQGLNVPRNQTLALIGGDVLFDGGVAISPGSRIQLGGLSEAGIIELTNVGANSNTPILQFPDNIQRGNVALTNQSEINVRADGGGDININARNVEISGGSVIRAGIDNGLGSIEAEGGDVNINVQDNVFITGAGSSIINAIDTNGIGQTGDINITANSLSMNNGAFINTLIFGQGNAGNINIKAASVEAWGTSPNGEFRSGFFANVSETGIGNAGNIYIETGQLRLTERGLIQSSTFGQGNAGSISIFATDSVELANSSILGGIAENAVGDTGNIEISTSSLNAINGQISLSASGNGNAGNIYLEAQQINLSDSIVFGETSGTGNLGNITIDTGTLMLRDGADIRLDVNPEATGSTGNITVNAFESIEIIGVSPTGITSRIATRTLGNGSAGSVIINTPRLAVRNGGRIFASSFNTGQAGDVIINALESVEVSGGSPVQIDSESVEFGKEPAISPEDFTAFFSDISTSSDNVEGSAGSVFITTNKLTIQEGGEIGTSATGRGSSGVVQVKANEVEIAGELTIDGGSSTSGLTVFTNGEGTAGTLNLETGRLTIRDGGRISVSSLNGSRAGSINIQASVVELIGDGRFPSRISVTTNRIPDETSTNVEFSGSSVGSITLEADQLRILNGAEISNFTGDIGSSGSIDIRANTIEISGRGTRTITLSTGETTIGSQISAQAGNGGNTGDISITTQRLIGQDGALIRTSGSGTGSSGSIQIQAQEVLFNDQVNISSGTDGAGNGGDITVETEQIRLLNNSVIFSGINFNESEIIAVEIPPSRRGGTVFIKASESIDIDGEETSIFTGISEGAIGNGGNLIIETGSLTVSNRASLSTGTQGNGNAGFMNIQAENIELTDRAFVIGLVSETGVGNGANITIETENLTLRDQAQLFTTTGGNGNAGSVNIQAENIELTDQSSILADVSETGVGNGGTVTVDAEQLTIRNQSSIIVNGDGVGNPGNIDVSASQVRLEQAALFADSVTGEGGNITINSPDISVRRQSAISAAGSQSGQTFDGNIDINSNFLVLLENSEIITSAFDPTGGSNINIRPLGNSELAILQSQNSIINAAGELSIDTTLNFDPPESTQVEVVDPAALIAQDPCKQRGDSQFIITGRGGIAFNPTQDLFSVPELELSLIEPVTPSVNRSSQRRQQQSKKRDNHPIDSRTIVPARGWIRDEKGDVILVGYDPTKTGVQRQPQPTPHQCNPEQ